MPREMPIKSRGPCLIRFCSGCKNCQADELIKFNDSIQGNLEK